MYEEIQTFNRSMTAVPTSRQRRKEPIEQNQDEYIYVDTRQNKITRGRREWRCTKGPESRGRVAENTAVEH